MNEWTLVQTHLDAEGLGEPLDDGEKGVGGEHGGLVHLSVDDLAQRRVAGRQPSKHLLVVINYTIKYHFKKYS